jgi:hypothetical protein
MSNPPSEIDPLEQFPLAALPPPSNISPDVAAAVLLSMRQYTPRVSEDNEEVKQDEDEEGGFLCDSIGLTNEDIQNILGDDEENEIGGDDEENEVQRSRLCNRKSALSLMDNFDAHAYQRFTCNEELDSHRIKMSRLARDPSKLEKRKIELERELEEAGISIRPRSEKQEHQPAEGWDSKYEELVVYRNENSHCNVPVRHKQLGKWVSDQRQQYKSEKLSDEQIRRLEEIGFNWTPGL